MSAVTNNRPFFSRQFFDSSSLRYYSCQQIKNPSDNDDDNEVVDSVNKVKRKGSTKTKRARSMARIINSNPWSSEVESSLSSSSPLSKTTVHQTLRLIESPAKALHFFGWVAQMGFSHDTQSFFSMLEILGRNRNLNVARNFLLSIERRSNGLVKLEDRFFNSLIRSYGNSGLFQESLKVFTMMKTMGVSPSVVSFNNLLLILLKRGRTNMAKSVFDEMLGTYGVTPDVYTFNILIRGFCKNLMVEEAFRFFKEMERFKCDPDVISYNTLVDGLCQAGKVRIARNLVKGMSGKIANLQPNVVTYTTLIRGYCMKQEIDEALVVLEEMNSRGLEPNGITYNTLIKGLCECKKFDKIKEILKGTGGDAGFAPDTCTFNTLMNAQCTVGNVNEAMKVFEKMLELKVKPDSATYSVLIRSLCQRGNFKRAEELFDELSEKEILLEGGGCTPLVAAYNPMFEYLCRNGKTKKAENVFRQLMKRGTQDPPSYKILIMGHCKEGTFKAGYELLVLMLRRDFVPDFETYESLITGLLQKGEPVLAFETLEKMLKSSHLPRASAFQAILTELLKNGCAHQSASLIMLMLQKGIRQDITLSTNTVMSLFGRGLRDKAFQLVGLLYENGYMIKMDEIVGFLCQHKRLVEACKMLLFSLEKKQSVNADMCDSVIESLCKINKLSEAFELYFKLVERGAHQQLSCLENLKVALEAGGKSNEAEYVSRRMSEKGQSEKSSEKLSNRRQRLPNDQLGVK